MIDFSAYTGWDIPEGKAIQVTNASGRVLWSSGPRMATVTITGQGAGCCNVKIGDTQYDGPATVTVPVGTQIEFTIKELELMFDDMREIKLNGDHLANGRFAYYIGGDLTANFYVVDDLYGGISITDPNIITYCYRFPFDDPNFNLGFDNGKVKEYNYSSVVNGWTWEEQIADNYSSFRSAFDIINGKIVHHRYEDLVNGVKFRCVATYNGVDVQPGDKIVADAVYELVLRNIS